MKICHRSLLPSVAILLALLLLTFGSLELYWVDGAACALAELLIGETIYAENYSEWKFRKVLPGMSERKVVQLLGEPVKRVFHDEGVSYIYATWAKSDMQGRGPDCCYTDRGVVLSNGVVTEILRGFYTD